MTKKLKWQLLIITIISIFINIGPVLFYTLKALVTSHLTYQKVAIVSTVFVVIIMTMVAMINKTVLRSRIWIVMIGIYIGLDSFIEPLMVIAICQTADELIVSPIRRRCSLRYRIRKEMDAK